MGACVSFVDINVSDLPIGMYIYYMRMRTVVKSLEAHGVEERPQVFLRVLPALATLGSTIAAAAGRRTEV